MTDDPDLIILSLFFALCFFLSPEMCKFIVNDCHANIVVVEDEKQLAKFEQVKQDLTDLKMIIQYGGQVDGQKEGLMSWQQLLEVGKRRQGRFDQKKERRSCTLDQVHAS